MKTTTLGIALCLIIGGAITFTPKNSKTKPTNPPANSCYLPGGGSCGSSYCHSVNANTGSGTLDVTFSGANNEYVPGNTYTLTVKVNDLVERYGFQAAIVNANNQSSGTLIVSDMVNTTTTTEGGNSFIGHKNAGGVNEWSFDWTAPASDEGPLKLYVAGNAANGNNQPTGDKIYTTQLPLNPAQGVGISSATTNDAFKIVSQDYAQLIVETGSSNEARTINMFSISGQSLYQNTIAAGETLVRIPCNHLTGGIYILHSGNNSIKFVKP